MEKQIACLLKACNQLGLTYRFFDKEENLLQVTFSWGVEYFQINKTPFNREVIMSLFRDKKHTYYLLNDLIRMPKTQSYLDFNVPPAYQHYCEQHSIPEIISSVRQQFEFPIVVKCNSGALGIGVYLCQNESAASQAFEAIFNKQSKDYDYLALAQQYIPTKAEYRLVCAFGEPVLAYKRGNANGFNARYWENNEVATYESDPDLINELSQFVKPIFSRINIGFVGCDIIQSETGDWFLIELNSSPKFNNFLNNNDESLVIEMYIKTLQMFIEKH